MASTPRSPTTAEAVRGPRDRRVVLSGLAAAAAVGWVYLAYEGLAPRAMADTPMAMKTWAARDVAALFAMWAIMMAAMMIPSAVPAVMLFARATATRTGRCIASAAAFAAGYVATWSAFSAAATLAQWALTRTMALDPAMRLGSPALAGALLILTGLYQFSPLKRACLRHCQSPLGFLLNHWREGNAGAFAMGFSHGVFCVGCCWALMALLFVLGVMNLAWIAALAAIVLLEKRLPRVRPVAGAAFIAWGALVLVSRLQ